MRPRYVAISTPDYVQHVAAIIRRWVVAAYRGHVTQSEAPDAARRLYEYLTGEDFRADFAELLDCANELDAQLATERRPPRSRLDGPREGPEPTSRRPSHDRRRGLIARLERAADLTLVPDMEFEVGQLIAVAGTI